MALRGGARHDRLLARADHDLGGSAMSWRMMPSSVGSDDMAITASTAPAVDRLAAHDAVVEAVAAHRARLQRRFGIALDLQLD
jgi:hypothetical protein